MYHGNAAIPYTPPAGLTFDPQPLLFSGAELGSRWSQNDNGQRMLEMTLAEDGPMGRKGQVIKLAVTPADVTVQTEELDTYLGGYRPFGFGADLFSKVVLVDKEAAQRRDFSLVNAFEEVETRTGRNGAINEVDHQSGLTPYRVQEFALASFIPWATENDATSLYNIRAATGEMIGWKLALSREVRIFTSLTTTANWNANNHTTLTSNFKWNGGSTSNPRLDLHNRIKASAQPINAVGMNPDAAYWFLAHTEVRDFMKQMLGDSAPSPEIAAAAQAGEMMDIQRFSVPGLPPIHIIPSKKLNLSTGNLDYILGNDVVLVTNQPGVPRDGNRVATHYTFRHRGRSGTGVVTNEYIPQGRGINSGTMFEMGYADADFVAANNAGGLIKDVVQ